jgi:hypothetical protein
MPNYRASKRSLQLLTAADLRRIRSCKHGVDFAPAFSIDHVLTFGFAKGASPRNTENRQHLRQPYSDVHGRCSVRWSAGISLVHSLSIAQNSRRGFGESKLEELANSDNGSCSQLTTIEQRITDCSGAHGRVKWKATLDWPLRGPRTVALSGMQSALQLPGECRRP